MESEATTARTVRLVPDSSASKGAGTLDDVVDQVGTGWSLAVLLVPGVGESFVCGAVKGLVPLAAAAVTQDLGLTSYQQGWLVSVMFAGNLVGNAASGFLADLIGRRLPLLGSFVVLFASSFASTLATSFWALFAARFVIGIGLGIGSAAWSALCCELCATSMRMLTFAFQMGVFSLGMMFAIWLIWTQDPLMTGSLQWREVTHLANVPVVLFFGLSVWLLDESPRYLARRGERDEADRVLARMALRNGQTVLPIWSLNEPADESILEGLGRRGLRMVLITTCVSCFVLNFVYYGTLYSLPLLLPSFELGLSPALSMLIGTAVEIPGLALGCWLGTGQRLSRKGSVLVYLAGAAASVALFWAAAQTAPPADEALHKDDRMAVALATTGIMGIRFFTSIGWLVVYLYMAEVYPTSCRASGVAIGMAFGRFGSVVCPLVYETSIAVAGYEWFFGSNIVLLLANAVAVAFLALETKDRQLGAISAETQPLTRA